MSPCEALTIVAIVAACIAAFIWAQEPAIPDPFDSEDDA